MEKIIISYLKKNVKKNNLKINNKTVLLNNGLELDSLEFLKLISYIEKKTKKKFINEGYQDLMNIRILEFANFFK